jgi:hypothetical protein
VQPDQYQERKDRQAAAEQDAKDLKLKEKEKEGEEKTKG